MAKRFGVRPIFAYLLAASLLCASLSALLPTPDERAQSALRKALPSLQDGGQERLQDPRERRALLGLLEALRRQGDFRGMRRAADILLGSPSFTGSELRQAVETVFYDDAVWGTNPPSWKMAALRKWLDSRDEPARPSDLIRLFQRSLTTLVFKAPPGKYRRIWVQGNWAQDGMISDMKGWRSLPMWDDGTHGDKTARDGRWTRVESLCPTRHRHLYHAVARTAPWPQGRAAGHAAFIVRERPGEALIRDDPDRSPSPAPPPLPGAKPVLKVSMLCIDGATWHVVLPLAYRGLLPNFARLMREGSILSTISAGDHYPTVPNLYEALTGKLIFRHGMEAREGEFSFNMSRKASPLWKIFDSQGRSSAVIAFPMLGTFPPDRVRGAMVSEAFFALKLNRDPRAARIALSPDVLRFAAAFGVTAADIERLMKRLVWIDGVFDTTYPESIAQELDAVLPARALDGSSGLTDMIRSLDEQVARAADALVRRGPYDLLFTLLCGVDDAGHNSWFGFEPEALTRRPEGGDARADAELERKRRQTRDALLNEYRKADGFIGFLLAHSENVLVFSDHGMAPAAYDFYTMDLDTRRLLETFRAVSGDRRLEGAEAYESGGRRTLRFPSLPERDADALEGLAACLRRAEYLPQGQPMFLDVAVKRAEVQFTLDQPRPIYVNGIGISGKKRSVLDFFDLSLPLGAHNGNGMLAVWGPDVRAQALPEPVPLQDAAPTALYLAGLPLAGDMDGRLLREILSPEALEKYPPRHVRTYGKGGSGWVRFFQAIRWKALWKRLTSPAGR